MTNLGYNRYDRLTKASKMFKEHLRTCKKCGAIFKGQKYSKVCEKCDKRYAKRKWNGWK